MLVTARTVEQLKQRRERRRLLASGYERVSENGAPLWKFQRGGWWDRRIEAVVIDPDGQQLWIKVSPCR